MKNTIYLLIILVSFFTFSVNIHSEEIRYFDTSLIYYKTATITEEVFTFTREAYGIQITNLDTVIDVYLTLSESRYNGDKNVFTVETSLLDARTLKLPANTYFEDTSLIVKGIKYKTSTGTADLRIYYKHK